MVVHSLQVLASEAKVSTARLSKMETSSDLYIALGVGYQE